MVHTIHLGFLQRSFIPHYSESSLNQCPRSRQDYLECSHWLYMHGFIANRQMALTIVF